MHPNHTSDEERYQKLMAIAPGPASAVPAVLSYLGDSSWRVRKAAVLALERFRDDSRLVPSLVAGLASDDNAGLRNACVQALTKMGASVTTELVRAIDSPDPGQRKFVAEVLGAIGTPQARDALIAHLGDPDVNVAGAVSEALGEIGGAEVVALLKERLAGAQDVVERAYGLDALVRAGARLPFEELLPWLAEPALARQVLALLGLSGDARSIAPLIDGLASQARQTRAVAALGLARLVDVLAAGDSAELTRVLQERTDWEAPLKELLDSNDDAVAAAVAKVMAASKRPELASAILAAVSYRSPVALGAGLVLAMGKDAVAPLMAAFDEVDVETRVLTLEVVESLGDSSVVPALLEIAQGPDNRSAEAALRVIGKLAGIDAVQALMERAKSSDDELAHAAAMAIASVGRRHPDPVATRVLAALAGGDERPVWPMVLGVIGRDEDCEVIARLAHHRDPAVRSAALEAAVTYGSEFPESIAIFALADEQP
ncbi:MAG: HEAT repeat domain-containing protein, partial [Deltaproteobacteria bacterium]|nr:HEAT repeat domain-containing protein [Deltaproteobacteria bacterium]